MCKYQIETHMKINVKKSIISVAAMAVCALFLTMNVNAAPLHTIAMRDTGKMSKMSKPTKMKAKKAGKMSKMSKMEKDTSKMSKM